MSADLSSRKSNGASLRVADALLRSLGGSSLCLRLPMASTDTSDAAQLGLNAPTFQDVPLAPALFRKVRVPMQEGISTKYEVLISASAVASLVAGLSMSGADTLFQMATGIVLNGKVFLLEAVSAPQAFGQIYLYRLLVRESQPQAQ